MIICSGGGNSFLISGVRRLIRLLCLPGSGGLLPLAQIFFLFAVILIGNGIFLLLLIRVNGFDKQEKEESQHQHQDCCGGKHDIAARIGFAASPGFLDRRIHMGISVHGISARFAAALAPEARIGSGHSCIGGCACSCRPLAVGTTVCSGTVIGRVLRSDPVRGSRCSRCRPPAVVSTCSGRHSCSIGTTCSGRSSGIRNSFRCDRAHSAGDRRVIRQQFRVFRLFRCSFLFVLRDCLSAACAEQIIIFHRHSAIHTIAHIPILSHMTGRGCVPVPHTPSSSPCRKTFPESLSFSINNPQSS